MEREEVLGVEAGREKPDAERVKVKGGLRTASERERTSKPDTPGSV